MNQQSTIIYGAEANTPGNISDKEKRVRCLAFDFYGYRMLVPGMIIAEVTDVGNIEPKKGAPDWFAGMMRWREVFVPVIIFEKIMNEAVATPLSYKKMIIFNAPDNIGGMHFIAVGCQSLPSLVEVDESRLAVSEKHNEFLTSVLLDGEEYVIPDISVFEKRVAQALTG